MKVIIIIFVEVCSLEVGTTVNPILHVVMVRSGTIIIVVALFVCYASYCVSMLKEASHGFRSRDL